MRISGISPEGKLIGAELLDLALIVSQLSAEFQQIAFEGGERLLYQIFGECLSKQSPAAGQSDE